MNTRKLFLPLLFALAAIFALPACEPTDTVEASDSNYYIYDGQRHSLAQGFIESWGANAGLGDFDIKLVSSSIVYDLNAQEYDGYGDVICLDLNSASTRSLQSGTYTFSTTRKASTFVDLSYFATARDAGTSSLTSDLNATGGTIEIITSGSKYEITFDLELEDGKMLEGYFSGSLYEIDKSK